MFLLSHNLAVRIMPMAGSASRTAAALLALAALASAQTCVLPARTLLTPAQLLDCWRSIPYNDTVARQTVESTLATLELYAFLARAAARRAQSACPISRAQDIAVSPPTQPAGDGLEYKGTRAGAGACRWRRMAHHPASVRLPAAAVDLRASMRALLQRGFAYDYEFQVALSALFRGLYDAHTRSDPPPGAASLLRAEADGAPALSATTRPRPTPASCSRSPSGSCPTTTRSARRERRPCGRARSLSDV